MARPAAGWARIYPAAACITEDRANGGPFFRPGLDDMIQRSARTSGRGGVIETVEGTVKQQLFARLGSSRLCRPRTEPEQTNASATPSHHWPLIFGPLWCQQL